MLLFNKNNGTNSLMDVIRCDEVSYLIWKWHPTGTKLGTNNRENAIRWGSSLHVKEGEVAAFIYRQKNGMYQDFVEGPFDEIVKTKNLPVLANLLGLAYNGDTPFQAEVYFINLAQVIQVPFGVPFFDVYDPRFLDFGVPVAVRGTISFRITDYRAFVRLHRLSSFDLSDFQYQIRDAVIRYVKDIIANAPAAHNIPVVQLESKIAQINDAMEYDISQRLSQTFGVTVSGVDIGAIEIDKSDEGYRQLVSVTKDLAGATVKAETEAKIRDIAAKQRIEAENYAETLRMQREEKQYAQRMHTRSTNMGAYQVEKQAEVGIAGANALGHMGEKDAGRVDMGSGGMGFNPGAIIASMTLGGVVGQNIAGAMGNAMNGLGQTASAVVPPPIPATMYHVVANGQATGPFDMNALRQMVSTGQLTAETLVWKAGMIQWEKAETVEELKNVLESAMPPAPPQL